MTCLRVANRASGSWKEISWDVNGGVLVAVAGAGALPADVGILSAFGGMLAVGEVGLGKGKDAVTMVIEILS